MAEGTFNIQFANENRGAEIGVNSGILHLNNHFYPSHGYQQGPHWMVPRTVSTLFTGRDEILKRLQDALQPSHSGDRLAGVQKRFVLHGIGGIGKSEICLKFANSVRNKFWGVFWVDVSSSTTAQRTFTKIAEKCGAQKQDLEGAKEWLANIDKEWLLILDNADDLNVDYADYFPTGNRGTILITTRNPECETHQTAGSEFVDTLESEASTTLLLKAVGIPEADRQSYKEAARDVVKALGLHTLAVIQAGAYVKMGYCRLEDYPVALIAERTRLLTFEPKQAKSVYGDVYATFEVSAKAIQSLHEPGAADAVALLRVLACTHHERIPIEMFEKAWKHAKLISNDTSWKPEVIDRLSIWHASKLHNTLPISLRKWDGFALRRACNLLASLSIIRVDDTASCVTMSMHSVTHAWAADRMSAEELKHAWETVGAILGLSIDDLSQHQPLWTLLLPHIHFYLEHNLTQRIAEQPAFNVAQILIRCSWVLYHLRDDKRLSTVLHMLGRAETKHSITVIDSLLLDSTTALNYLDLGKFDDAVALMEKVVEIAERTLDAKYEWFSKELQRVLAHAYGEKGQHTWAVVILELMLAALPETNQDENPTSLRLKHELAIAHIRVKPQNNESLGRAVKLLEDVVAMEFSTLDRGWVRKFLARLRVTTRSTVSRDFAHQAFDAMYLDPLNSEHELARAYLGLGNGSTERAVAMLEHLVPFRRRMLDNAHPSRLASKYLARAFLDLGDNEAAVVLLEQVVAIRRRTLNITDPRRLQSEHLLAKAFIARGASATMYGASGRLAPAIAVSKHYTSNERAVEMLEDIVANQKTSLKNEDPNLLASQRLLGKAYIGVEKYAQAIELLEHVVAVESDTLEETDTLRLASQQLLATSHLYLALNNETSHLYLALNNETSVERAVNIERAVNMLENVVAIQRTLDAENPRRLMSEYTLANAYLASHDDASIKPAMELLEHVVAVQRTTLEAKDLDRMAAQVMLASAHMRVEQYEQAVKLLEEVVDIRRTILDAQDPYLVGAEELLITAYARVAAKVPLEEESEKSLMASFSQVVDKPIEDVEDVSVQQGVEMMLQMMGILGSSAVPERLKLEALQRLLTDAGEAFSTGSVKRAAEILEQGEPIRNTIDPKNTTRLRSEALLGAAYMASDDSATVKRGTELLQHAVSINSGILVDKGSGKFSIKLVD